MAEEANTQFSEGEMISDVVAVKEGDAAMYDYYEYDPFVMYSYTSPLEHAMAVMFFLVVGLFGNSITIHIYRRKANKVGGTYIRALAYIDVFMLVMMLPVYPFLEQLETSYIVLYFVYLGIIQSLSNMYLWILVTMTLERVVAVFRPFKLRKMRKPIQRVMLALSLTQVVIIWVEESLYIAMTWDRNREILSNSLLLKVVLGIEYRVAIGIIWVTIATVLVAYPAIIYQLVYGNAMKKYADKERRAKKEERANARRETTNDIATVSGLD